MVIPTLAALAAFAITAPAAPASLPVGRFFYGGHSGTAFLVSPCEAASAKHVSPRGQARVGARTKVWMAGQTVGATVTAVGVHPDPMAHVPQRGGDWLLVRLDRCLGTRLGYFRLLQAPLLATSYFHRRDAMIAGYPGGKRKLVERAGCATLAVLADGTIEVDCSTLAGMSGGPLFVREASGRLTAFGIHSAGGGSQFGFAADVSEMARVVGPSIAEGQRNAPIRTSLSKMEETRSAFR